MWMREFIDYDPMVALAAASAPILAMTGSKDVQVDPADLPLIEATAQALVEEVPDVDHILRHVTAAISNPRHYAKQARKPIDPRVTEAILVWLAQHHASEVPAG